jgi:hypothetical protein
LTESQLVAAHANLNPKAFLSAQSTNANADALRKATTLSPASGGRYVKNTSGARDV